MQDHSKPYQEVIAENVLLRQRILDLERLEAEHERALEALRESEANYRQLFDNSPSAVYRVDFRSGKFIKANDVFCKYLDCSPDEITSLSPYDLLTEGSKQLFLERLEKMALGENVSETVEYEIIDRKGIQRCVHLHNRNICDAEGHVVASDVVAHDITERKRAEEALRESEDRYRSLFANSIDAILFAEPSGGILAANPEACRIFGRSEEEICRIGRAGLLDGSDPRLAAALAEQERTGRFRGELTFVRKDGTTFPGEMSAVIFKDRNGKAMCSMAIRDITKRRQAEEALQDSQAFYHSLVDQLNAGVFRKDREGRFVFVSPGFCRLKDTNEETFLGKTPREVAAGDAARKDKTGKASKYAAQGADHHVQIMQTGKPIELVEEYTNGDGRKQYVHARKIPVFNDAGRVIGTQGILFDITDHKNAEEENLRLAERLQRSEKMEALGKLAGGVAHDLNNVLGILSGYSELLLMEIPAGHRFRNYVETIMQSTTKGAAIVQDLLTMARRGVNASDVINLNHVVSGFLKTPVFERLKEDYPLVTIRTVCDASLLNIKGSPIHLEKTLVNLVSNAVESISGRGEVTIRTESRYLDRVVTGYDKVRDGDYAVLTVSDTGMGIPAEDREKIFEPFYTKKKMGRSGTGLGLAIVWGTVKDHHGYIDVQTEAGQGSTFTLYFPVCREEPVVSPQKVQMERYMGHGESVLVVDDVAEQRQVATAMLTKLGYRVHAVAGGEDAVAYLKDHPADILVLDMIMEPGIDGLETFQRVREINPRQKAIIVSGFSETDRVMGAQRLGAGAYVRKPYVLEHIGLALREELDRK